MVDDTWRSVLPRTWVAPDGDTVSCTEKLKVLEEDLAEIAELAQDALEDAIFYNTRGANTRNTKNKTRYDSIQYTNWIYFYSEHLNVSSFPTPSSLEIE